MKREKTVGAKNVGAYNLYKALHDDNQEKKQRLKQLSLERDKKFEHDRKERQSINFDKKSQY